MERPKVGVGVIIENERGQVLVGKRISSYAPYYSIPGGHLELGETFEEAGIKEVKEECNIDIFNPKVICLSNNLRTYKESGVHFVSVILHTKEFVGQPILMEPDKCEGWDWVDPHHLPYPHFDASEYGINCFLNKKFYISKT